MCLCFLIGRAYQGNVTFGKPLALPPCPELTLGSVHARTALPAIHPVYGIPTEPNGANHTPQFAKSARTVEAHEQTLKVAVGLAAVGFKVLKDAQFAEKVLVSLDIMT